MQNKILFVMTLSMMISFSAGIFVEMISPGTATVTPETSNFVASLLSNVKSDCFTIILALFFTFTIYLMPCIGILVLCKTFSLGFSAAYLLSADGQGLGILLAVIFPRTLLKLPAYVLLFLISWKTASQLKTRRHNISEISISYALCLLALILSSLIEVVLLQAVF